MCGRYNFTRDAGDMAESIVEMMDRRYPGEYKTGEIFPGDTAPMVGLCRFLPSLVFPDSQTAS